MRARLLGTAAGGGLPQWNCACAGCARARRAGPGASQDCLAITGTGRRWFLVNASPDIRTQILAAPELAPGPGLRETPVAGVLLTDAELDHTIGLLVLREGSRLDIYGPGPVLDALDRGFPVRGILASYGSVSWQVAEPGVPLSLDEQLTATTIALGRKRPRYARDVQTAGSVWVVAYRFEDSVTGGSLVYAPCVAAWTPALDAALTGADCVIVDGTFLHDDEMTRVTGQGGLASEMGHLPITDSLDRLRAHPAAHKVYTHLNNTNPVLAPDSPERATLAAAGITVAGDGLTLDL